jgi:uncharacterized protein YeaO (DUF488 family)
MYVLKRIYDKYSKEDGYSILIDRLWPRGISKTEAKIDLWMKDIAPSKNLREWFSHDPQKWEEFQVKYKSELLGKKELIDQITEIEKNNKKVTILYAAKDTKHNNAVALLNFINKQVSLSKKKVILSH